MKKLIAWIKRQKKIWLHKIETYWWLSVRVWKRGEQWTSQKSNEKEPPKNPTKTDVNELTELIIKKETGTKRKLFKKYFNFQTPTAMLKNLYD